MHSIHSSKKIKIGKPLGSSFAYTNSLPFKMQARREQDGKHSIGIGKPKRAVC